MAFQVNWTKRARADLRNIHAHLLDTEPSAIDIVVGGIWEEVAKLAESPFRGEIYQRTNGDLIRETLSGRYRIFFCVFEESQRVEIIRVWHSSRREPNLNPGSSY